MSSLSSKSQVNNMHDAKNVGRPKAITLEVVRELVQCFKEGLDIKSACVLSGISTSSY